MSNQNVNGLEITIESNIPIGVGLGSSSACCVAAAASISGLFNELSREEIINLAIDAEKSIFPDTSGADCTVCTYGGMIEHPGIEKIDSTFDLNLLIANSMIPHSTKTSVEKVSKFKENNEERFSQLCDLENGLIDEVIVAMKNNDSTSLGLKMTENQKYLEEIQVSNDTLRDMISSLSDISLGSKITGAGDGGCIIALVKDENVSKVPALLGKDKECFSAKLDTKGVVWCKIE
jgi:mevalonate kinase